MDQLAIHRRAVEVEARQVAMHRELGRVQLVAHRTYRPARGLGQQQVLDLRGPYLDDMNLRISQCGAGPVISGILWRLECASAQTCEVCGRPGKVRCLDRMAKVTCGCCAGPRRASLALTRLLRDPDKTAGGKPSEETWCTTGHRSASTARSSFRLASARHRACVLNNFLHQPRTDGQSQTLGRSSSTRTGRGSRSVRLTLTPRVNGYSPMFDELFRLLGISPSVAAAQAPCMQPRRIAPK